MGDDQDDHDDDDDGDDDHDLRRRWLGGDKSVLIDLTRLYHERVHRFFRHNASNDADELTQRTFERLAKFLERYEGRGSIRSFIFGIAHNVLREWVREIRREAVVDIDEVTAEALDPTPSKLLVQEMERRVLLRALRRLPLSQQVVLQLSYWEHMSDREIGKVLDISPHTVRGRLSRARKVLRKLVEELEATGGVQETTTADLEAWAPHDADEADDDDADDGDDDESKD